MKFSLCFVQPVIAAVMLLYKELKISREQRKSNTSKSLGRHFEDKDKPLQLTEKVVRQILDDLCLTLGYCLPPKEQERIIHDPPKTPRQFSEAVMDAEGISTSDSKMFRAVYDIVLKRFIGV